MHGEKKNIIGIEVNTNGERKSKYNFYEHEIMSIEMWKPKSNYNIPIFYSKAGAFTVLTTLEECTDAFPAFHSLDGSNLVNLKNIDHLGAGNFGGVVRFKNSDVITGVNKKSILNWDMIVADAKAYEIDERIIFVNKITKSGLLEQGRFIYARDVNFIESWEPKRNYHVPKFHTSEGSFSAGLTFQSCRDAIPYFYPAHNGNLVNIDLIERIEEQAYGWTVYFKDSEHTSIITNDKAKQLKKLTNV